jgi:hypothetical protein
MTWDRVQRLELDLAGRDARIRQLEEELAHAVQAASDLVTRRAALMLLDSVTAQRDSARSVACRLEQELAHAEQLLDTMLELVDEADEAQLAAYLAGVDIRTRREEA